MPRYTLVVFASLLMISSGGCNKTMSTAAAPGSATAANAAATTGAAVTSASLDSPPSNVVPETDQDAIRTAIQQHLASNGSLNMAAMDMNVVQTSVNGDQAQANVEFRLKQGGTTMQMTYSLIRHAAGWLVTNSHPGGGQFAHPPMDHNHAGVAPDAPPNSGTPAMPDVHDFFKNAPARQKQ